MVIKLNCIYNKLCCLADCNQCSLSVCFQLCLNLETHFYPQYNLIIWSRRSRRKLRQQVLCRSQVLHQLTNTRYLSYRIIQKYTDQHLHVDLRTPFEHAPTYEYIYKNTNAVHGPAPRSRIIRKRMHMPALMMHKQINNHRWLYVHVPTHSIHSTLYTHTEREDTQCSITGTTYAFSSWSL